VARGAAQAQRKQQAQTAPKKKQAAPSWEDQLFFSRLRRHAKWVYVFLAVVFALGFVVLGIGSGSTGITDVLRGNFFGGGGNSTSSQIKDQQQKINQNPKNIEAYLNLSTLYQQEQQTPQAIATLEQGAKVEPKNLDVLNRLAGIYRTQAESSLNAAASAQAALSANNSLLPGLDPGSPLGQDLGTDPVSKSLSQNASESFSKMSTAFSKAEAAYQRVATAARGTAQEASSQLQLGSVAVETLRLTGQPTDALRAITAFKRYLQLAPDGANAAQARQTIAQLETFLQRNQSQH
jgi:tetratricopeptide (TPR) repeat protein